MKRTRTLGLMFAIGIALSFAPSLLQASKVAFDPEPLRNRRMPDDAAQARELSAAPAKPESPAPPAVRPAVREPLRYDALPEQERKRHALDEILRAAVEV